VYRETGERSRLMLDVSNYRANRKSELEEVGRKAVEDVRATGEAVRLDPMTPFERKVVHDVVAAAGLRVSRGRGAASSGRRPAGA
jgi:spoIIIJ-associated protein